MPGSVVIGNVINSNALQAPGLYTQILDPKNALIQGIPTNVIGLVGIASWGPIGSPETVSSQDDFQTKFGQVMAKKYDMGSHIAILTAGGANNMRCVRVTDGTETAATVNVMDTAETPTIGMILTAFYTGEVGNTIKVFIAAGSNSTVAAPTYKITIARPNYIPEVFDNIGGTGAALWQNMVTAINQGLNDLRGPSQLIAATAGVSTAAPNIANYTLAGGTNGDTTITGTVLVGSDTTPRKGMYALRATGCNIAFLCDCDDTSTYSIQVAYGASEGTFMFLTGSKGQTITQADTALKTAGIDSFVFKFLLGDWIYFKDTYNNQERLISPQSAAAARYASLSPEESGLNKQIVGILGTQTSYARRKYSNAEIIQAEQARIDFIATPAPGNGNFFALQTGLNGSSNALTKGDEYTRLTFFLAYSIETSLGVFIGRLNNPSTRLEAKSSLDSFLQALKNDGMIEDFRVILDLSNNPVQKQKQGYMQADVEVSYFGIVRVFLVNLQSGVVSIN